MEATITKSAVYWSLFTEFPDAHKPLKLFLVSDRSHLPKSGHERYALTATVLRTCVTIFHSQDWRNVELLKITLFPLHH